MHNVHMYKRDRRMLLTIENVNVTGSTTLVFNDVGLRSLYFDEPFEKGKNIFAVFLFPGSDGKN